MRTAFCKITAAFFLLAAFSPLLYIPLSGIKQQLVKLRMKEKLERRQGFQTVRVPVADVVWMDDHEIWVNDHMFDIRDKRIENGMYIFTGLYDEEETKLVKERNQVTKKSLDDLQALTRLLSLLQNSYDIPGQPVQPVDFFPPATFPPPAAEPLPVPYRHTSVPPPWVV